MGKYYFGALAAAATLGMGAITSGAVLAEAPDCSAVDSQTKLTTCIEAQEDITLGGDIELSNVVTIKGGYNAKINLNNHTITRNANSAAFQIRQGRLVLEGTGTVERFGINSDNSRPTIRIYGSAEEQTSPYSSLIVGENVTLTNNDDAAIGIDANETGAFHGIDVSFKGMAFARYGIRVAKDVNSYDGMPTIEIADGAMINAETGIETDAPGQAIRAEGPATWNIGRASIVGDTGVALRAGKFYFNGPTVTATGPEEAYIHHFALNKSGDTYCETEICEKLPGSGAAIQIQEEKTEAEDGINEIEIFINGGTYTSKYGYAISEYKEREENSTPKILTDTLKTLKITEGNLIAFTDISEEQKTILKNQTRYTLIMVTDDFSWRFGDGRMCADGSASVKSFDEDWLRTHFEVHRFARIEGLDAIYTGLPWIERLLVDHVHFPGPYDQYRFTDAENVALDIYAESKGMKYEDIKFTNLFELVLYRFEKDDADSDSIEGEEGYFRGTLTDRNPEGLTSGTSKPYAIIRDTEIYPLTFTMKLPENLPAVPEGYTRNYKVLDLHCQSGGTAAEAETCEAIELPVALSEDGTEYTFTTTKFSKFIFTYNDVENPTPEDPTADVPDTGFETKTFDKKASSAISLGSIIAVASVLSLFLFGAKKFFKKQPTP